MVENSYIVTISSGDLCMKADSEEQAIEDAKHDFLELLAQDDWTGEVDEIKLSLLKMILTPEAFNQCFNIKATKCDECKYEQEEKQ